MLTDDSYIYPAWPAPETVRAVSTTRLHGHSSPPYDSFNLAAHVDDNPDDVASNRQRLREQLELPDEPGWLNQVHGKDVLQLGDLITGATADGSYSRTPGQVCAVLTADCLPVLICNQDGTEVAAVHAGWRGLAAGIVGVAVERFTSPADQLLVWLGPAIGPAKFEVGADVYQAFVNEMPEATQAFHPNETVHWHADIYSLARMQLERLGVSQVYGGEYCTFSDATHFYSYRRDGVTGRMATLIWLEN